MKVVVFGGTGFVGRNLKEKKREWIYPSSKQVDLTNAAQVHNYLVKIQPDYVVNLAGIVGGIKYNTESTARHMMHDNYMIMANVMQSCDTLYIRSLTTSSTCAWPKKKGSEYPLNEDYMDGKPESSNRYYAYGKRMGMILSESYPLSEILVLSNIYGPRDHFFSEDSHFIPAIISRYVDTPPDSRLEVWGDGKPFRQMVYVEDVVDAIIHKVENEETKEISYLLGNNENIGGMIYFIRMNMKKYFKKYLNIQYNGEYPGIKRKDVKVAPELECGWLRDNDLTTFPEGVEKTIKWFKENEVRNGE